MCFQRKGKIQSTESTFPKLATNKVICIALIAESPAQNLSDCATKIHKSVSFHHTHYIQQVYTHTFINSTTMSSKSTSEKSVPRRIDFDDSPKEDKQQKDVSPIPLHVPTSPRNKRTLQTYLSPVKKTSKGVALVTPCKKSRLEEELEKKEEDYVPTYIYKNIDYKRQGDAKLGDVTKKIFELVQENFELPKDLETNRKYGPKSGVSFEEHAIRAYTQGMLEAKDQSVDICTACARKGHQRDGCPKLI
jgi:hypothetical protein